MQVISNRVLGDIGFSSHPMITQQFLYFTSVGLTSLLSKIADDLLLCGPPEHVDDIILKLKDKFTLGTIAHRPRTLRYFRFNNVQYEDYTISSDGDDKLDALAAFLLTKFCRREVESRPNPV